MTKLVVRVGLNVPDPKKKDGAELRLEPGDELDASLVAVKTLRALVEQGCVEEVK